MSESERIARAFVAARREARALDAYPGTIPATLGEAYAIQDRAIAFRGGEVAGWKVGRIPAPLIARFGTDRLAGPIFADRVTGADPSPAMPVFAGGFAAAEVEFLLRIGTAPDPAKRTYSHEEAAAAFLFALAAERGIALRPGQWISSGAVNGVHEMRPGERAVARFGDALEVRCAIGVAVAE